MARGKSKKIFECGHKGFGNGYCHRCGTADKLDEMVKGGKHLVTHKKAKKPKKWSLEEMCREVDRLREVSR